MGKWTGNPTEKTPVSSIFSRRFFNLKCTMKVSMNGQSDSSAERNFVVILFLFVSL